MKKLSFFAVFAALALQQVASAQQSTGLSSMGEDFYFCRLAPSFKCSHGYPEGYALISSVYEGCVVSIDYFDGAGFELTSKTIILHAGQSMEYPIDPNLMSDGANPNGEVPMYIACHITSNFPISVFYYSNGGNAGAMTLVLPTAALGKSYVVATLPANPGIGAGNSCSPPDSSSSEFAIVAVRDSTTVTITPNGLTRGGHIGARSGAGETGTPHPFQTKLQRGQVYWVKSTVNDPSNDMSGSTVTSSWPVAVFAGNEDALNGESTTLANGGDQRNMLMQQMVPTQFWRDSGYISIPFIDPPDLGAYNPSEGEAFKFFTSNSRGTTVNFSVNQQGTDNLNVTPFQNPPAMEENVLATTTTASQNGAPIMLEQYDYRGQGSSAPYSSPTMVNVVPLQNFATVFAFMVPRETSSTDNRQYINMIVRRDQYANVKVWQNGSLLALTKLIRVGSIYPIPGHSELEGMVFEIPFGDYYFRSDSAFMVYQYGMLTDGNYYSEYATPTCETFHIDGASTPNISADTLCSSWNVTVRDTAAVDGGIASIELLEDPNGILVRRPGTDSGYVSTNIRSVNLAVTPGDTTSSFDIIVTAPDRDATAWVLVTNEAGNSQLLRLFYAAQNLSFLTTQKPLSNSASFLHSRLDVDTCTELVLKNLAAMGGKPVNVTGFHFIKGDTAFRLANANHAVPFELASGDSLVFNICFDPTDTNAHIDSLLVETDCMTETAAVTGSAQVGIIIAGDGNFGKLPVGDTMCENIEIRNVGSAPFIITSKSILGSSSDFNLAENEFPDTIQAGKIVLLPICFVPHNIGTDSLLIHWITNVPEPFTHDIKDSSIILGYGMPSRLSVAAATASTPLILRVIPSGGQLKIFLPPELEGAHIAIFDELGRELRTFESKSQTESLDVADLINGSYYVRASERNIVKTATFMIAH